MTFDAELFEERWSELGIANVAKHVDVAGFSRGGEPLDTMFIGARVEAEKLGDAAIEFADGIRIENFIFEREPVPFPAPLGATAQVTLAIERDDDGVLKWRGQISSGRMGRVMID